MAKIATVAPIRAKTKAADRTASVQVNGTLNVDLNAHFEHLAGKALRFTLAGRDPDVDASVSHGGAMALTPRQAVVDAVVTARAEDDQGRACELEWRVSGTVSVATAPKRRRSPPKPLEGGIDVLAAVRLPAAIPFPPGEWIAWDMRHTNASLGSANGQNGPSPTLHVLALAEGYRFTLAQHVYGDVPNRNLGEREGAAGSGIGPDSRIEVGDRFRFSDGDPAETYTV